MMLQSIARTVLAVFCGIQGLATAVMDLNRTHAAHPQWLGHARFHVVWQTGTVMALAIVEVGLLCFHGPFESERFYLAALLAMLPMLGFFAAVLTRRLYGGTFSDPGGIPPARFDLRGREIRVDMNLVAEMAGLITVALMVALYRFAKS
jgi:Na+/H+-translocating membrane pyrophosphatase